MSPGRWQSRSKAQAVSCDRFQMSMWLKRIGPELRHIGEA
jgi:hypothetical protein